MKAALEKLGEKLHQMISKISLGILMSGLGLVGLIALIGECSASSKLRHANDSVTTYKEGPPRAWLVRYNNEERIVIQRHVTFELDSCVNGWIGPWVFDRKFVPQESVTTPWCEAVDTFLKQQKTAKAVKEIQF